MTDNKELNQLVLTCDLGASLTKAIAMLYPVGIPQLITMSPQIVDVEKESVNSFSIDSAAVDSTWISIFNDHYVLGSLARTLYGGTAAIRDLKYHYALPKVAALAWQAFRQLNLHDKTEIFVHLLLPPNELKDGKELSKQFSMALKQGVFTPNGKLKLKLGYFHTSPEGSGVLINRRNTLGHDYPQKRIGILMLGYRNASFTLIEGGNQTFAESTDLGMNWVVRLFVEQTSVGLSSHDPKLTKALVEASSGELSALRALSRKVKEQDIESDFQMFQDKLSVVRREYSRALVRFLRNLATLDEVVVCGGTGEFVRTELTEYFQQSGIPIVWNGGVQIPDALNSHKFGERIADVWSAHTSYIKMLDLNFKYQRTLPLFPEKITPTPPTPQPEPKLEPKSVEQTRPNHDPWKNFLPMKEGI